ncbi:hypothetical protein J4558_10345 [Leptolyngbya sp. 15MV]|nr:hypothetical protein J4558_10345 [Leptolyngbya sp. 15MV]
MSGAGRGMREAQAAFDVAGDDVRRLAAWIALNEQALTAYRNGDIAYTEDALAALRKLPT